MNKLRISYLGKVKRVAIFLMGIALFSNAFSSDLLRPEPRTLEILTLHYPPYEYEEDGMLKGIAVDVVEEVFNRMDHPIQINLVPWDRALSMIEHGAADALFTAYKTPEREAFCDFSNEVLVDQTISLFVREDSTIQFDGDLSSLEGYTLGTVRKLGYGSVMDKALKHGVLTNVEATRTAEKNMAMLILNRVDVLVSNKYGAYDILKRLKRTDKVKELTPSIEHVSSYLAFSKKRNLSHIRDQFDFTLKEMKMDGSYQRIINSYSM